MARSLLPESDCRLSNLLCRARIELFHRIAPDGQAFLASTRTKKADVAEFPEVFRHVGLLTTKPPGMAGLLSIKSSDGFVGKAAVNRAATLPPLQSYAAEWEMQWAFFPLRYSGEAVH